MSNWTQEVTFRTDMAAAPDTIGLLLAFKSEPPSPDCDWVSLQGYLRRSDRVAMLPYAGISTEHAGYGEPFARAYLPNFHAAGGLR